MTEMERRQVLEMLAAGKINVSEAAEILNLLSRESATEPESAAALKAADPTIPPDISKLKAVGYDAPATDWQRSDLTLEPGDLKKPRWLRIRVRDLSSGRSKVNINLPLGLVSVALKVAERFGADVNGALNVNGIEMGQLMAEALREGNRGMFIDVEDEEDGEHVQIFLD